MKEELSKICKLNENAPLIKYNTYKLNSYCAFLCFVDKNNLNEVISILKKYKSKFFILGNGSNVIIPTYYDGVIIKLEGCNELNIYDDYIDVGSSYMINKLAIELAGQGYEGLDFLAGVPGTVGGCIYGNAGCYGKTISDVLIDVTVLDKGKIKVLKNEELNFEYRNSIFKNKSNKMIILSARFKISKGNKEEIMSLIKERQEKRNATQDLNHPSCGSVFRNPEGLIAGKLIDDAGLKGFSVGGAMVSLKHANFIINNDKATYEDIVSLIKKVKNKIKKIYNIDLVLEQEIIK